MPIFRRDFERLFLSLMLTAPLGCSDGANAEGSPEGTYPAFPIDAPQIVRADAGAVMTAPTVRLITFAGDPLQADIAKLVEQVRTPAYWTATTAEYGVGPLSIGAPIVVDEVAPRNADGATVETWLTGKFDGTHADFGTPDEQTIYLVVYPAPTTLKSGLTYACGFHYGASIGGMHVHYAAVTECARTEGREAQVNALASSISHELIESASDPDPELPAHGYLGFDPDHAAWQYYWSFQLNVPPDDLEIADLCESDIATFPGSATTASSAWSNAAIRAGHDPCVPRPDLPYFNAMPVLHDDVEFDRPLLMGRTKGVNVPVGESRTIEVDLFSDRQVLSPWFVVAEEPFEASKRVQLDGGELDDADDASPVAFEANPEVAYSWDRSTGLNGDKLHLTITRLRSASEGSTVVLLISQLGEDENYWPFVVGQ
jgi:hypothetical protein